MSARKSILVFLVILLAVLAFSSMYTVTEGQRALVLRLGKLELDAKGNPEVKQPGLHFKWPFINQIRIFDVRLQTLDIKSSRIVTKEKKDVLVDYYAKWRIDNPALYYMRTGGDVTKAETLLKQQLNDNLRAAFGQRTISEVVSDDRTTIMQKLQSQASKTAKRLGIFVLDVRIKGIDLPDEVRSSVFDRMKAERKRVATKHRADGRAQAEKIRASADAEATVIVAKAKETSATTRARGDAKAAKIFAKAYGKDESFYKFYRSLLAYEQSFSQKQDVLVLRPNSQFFKYFNNSEGDPVEANR